MNITPRVNSRRTSPTASGKVKRPVTPPPRIPVRRDSQDPFVYDSSTRSSPTNRPGLLCQTPLRTAPTPASQDELESKITFAANVEVFNSSADEEGSGPVKDEDSNSSMSANMGRGRKVSRNRCECAVY